MEDLIALRQNFHSGSDDGGPMRPIVLESWRRSRAHGVDPADLPRQSVNPQLLQAARVDNRRLLMAAEPFLRIAHERLGTRPHVIALSDSEAYILVLLAEPEHLPEYEEGNFFEGASWHERDMGCNGIGTALATDTPVILIGSEHFQVAYEGWTSIGVPLHSSDGGLIGALDLSIPNDDVHTGTWGFILSIAAAIEESIAAHEANRDGSIAWNTVADLENPFNGVRGILELLFSHAALSPTLAKVVADAQKQVADAEAEFLALAAMQRHTELELRELNRTLRARVDERTKEIEQRKKEVRQLAFIASHDIQEPLRKIQTLTTLLAHQYADKIEDEGRDYLSRTGAAAQELSAVLSDLLLFGRTAVRKHDFMPLHIRDVIDRSLKKHEDLIENTDASIRIAGDGRLNGNSGLLSRMMDELIKNALIYRRAGIQPRIDISISLTADAAAGRIVAISVSDNGIGFEQKYHELVFEPFERLCNPEEYPGTGMGLALCRHIVERHEGTISAESSPDAGTRIVVRLPTVAPTAAETRPPAALDFDSDEEGKGPQGVNPS